MLAQEIQIRIIEISYYSIIPLFHHSIIPVDLIVYKYFPIFLVQLRYSFFKIPSN
jgi:hypothetical protein